MNTRPLIHIGYHKTGTTWLQKHVFSERDLGFIKVPSRTLIDEAFVTVNPFAYDAAVARTIMAPTIDEAARMSKIAVISHERLSGSPLLGGYDARMIADRLHEAYPDAQVLVVIREQKAMLLSVYKQHIVGFGSDRLESIWRQRTLREQRRPGPLLEFFEYHHLIRHYQRLFGRERVLVLPYELLMQQPHAFVTEVTRSTGLPEPTDVDVSRENPGLPALSLALLRYINLVMTHVGLEKTFSGPAADSKIRGVRRRTVKAVGRFAPAALSKPIERRWRDKVAQIAADRFGASNRITSELIGEDLARFGYDVDGAAARPSPDRALVPDD